MNNDIKKSGNVHTATQILQTRDYSIFKKMPGNRDNDVAHVKKLIKNMMEVGNLTAEFPVVLNEKMQIVDGQHRIAALKELGWPVGYRIQEGLTLDTVRGINQAGQNWSWRDYAVSFVSNGTPEQVIQYAQLLRLIDKFNVSKTVVMIFCSLSSKSHLKHAVSFKQGDLVIPNVDRTEHLLAKYKEITSLLTREDTTLARAVYNIIQNPIYDHQRMLHKLKVSDSDIKRMGTVEEYARALEVIYNWKVTEDNRVRLF